MHTPGVCGDGPRIYRVIFAAASASVADTCLEGVTKIIPKTIKIENSQ